MKQGKIARIVPDRGFGFITVEGEEKDIFFHAKDLRGVQFEELKEEDMVSFEVVDGPKGPQAKNVERV